MGGVEEGLGLRRDWEREDEQCESVSELADGQERDGEGERGEGRQIGGEHKERITE